MEIDKSRFHKTVVGPFTGQEFVIRRVRTKEFMQAMGALPIDVSGTVQDVLNALKEKAAASGDNETEAMVTKFYATKGVVEPTVWFGEEKACPEGQIYYQDLGGDLDYVVGEVIRYSHELAGLAEYGKFFRESVARDTGPDGEKVRAEAVEPAADGNVQ